MPVELVIAPEAELDIADAYAWYQHRRAGLGEEFLSSVDACLECIGVDLVCTLSHPDFTFDKDFGYAECTGPGVICKQQAQGSDRCVHFRHNLPLLVVVLLIKHVFIDGVSRFLPLLSMKTCLIRSTT